MRLVDDEYLVAVARGPVPDIFPQLAHFIDAAIGRRVDLDNVRGAARGDLHAARTDPARPIRRPIDAVQAARQNAGDGCLPGPALAGENVAVRDPVLRDGVLERRLDVLL